MYEVWLRPNLRAMRVGLLAPAVIAAMSLAAIFSGIIFLAVVGWIGIALSGSLFGLIVWLMRRPMLAYESGHLLVNLRNGPPIRLPIDVVEAFFLGSGPLKLSDEHSAPYQTTNLITRLAEKATDWAERPVKPALGRWHESYITVHGAWCETLSLEVVSRLNVRLHQIQHASDDSCQSTNALTHDVQSDHLIIQPPAEETSR